jgi:hypothetical protein
VETIVPVFVHEMNTSVSTVVPVLADEITISAGTDFISTHEIATVVGTVVCVLLHRRYFWGHRPACFSSRTDDF